MLRIPDARRSPRRCRPRDPIILGVSGKPSRRWVFRSNPDSWQKNTRAMSTQEVSDRDTWSARGTARPHGSSQSGKGKRAERRCRILDILSFSDILDRDMTIIDMVSGRRGEIRGTRRSGAFAESCGQSGDGPGVFQNPVASRTGPPGVPTVRETDRCWLTG